MNGLTNIITSPSNVNRAGAVETHKMIVEERCYTLRMPYGPQDYLALYEAEGLEVQRTTLGSLLGYFHTEVGGLNTMVHLWGYDSFDERMRRRAALAADPSWQRYLVRIRPLIESMSNRLLVPTSFSPIR
jgi:NIPSNAP protein